MRRTLKTGWATGLAAALVAGLAAIAVPPAAQAQTAPEPIVTGWFGWWAKDSQVQALANQSDGVVDEVNIFWWTFAGPDNPICVISATRGVCDPSGPTPWTNTKFDGQRRILQDAGIKVLGSITDLGSTYAGQLSPYLDDPANRREYARTIARYAKNAGLDGVDLDWENFAFRDRNLGITWAETRPRWIAMMKRLSRELHDQGLILSLTIPGGKAYWGGDTGVYALSEVIDYADRVRFMTYDYSWNVPGPIGPTGWARDQIEAAIDEVGQQNAAKMWVGNPQYGRQWVVNQGTYSNPDYGTNANCPNGWAPGYYSETSGAWVSTAMSSISSPDAALAIAQANGIEPQWNSSGGEWTFTYTPKMNGRYAKDGGYVERECRVEREVWFGDTRSALADASMVPDLGIGGIAVWNFGSLREDFYPRLVEYGREIAPAETAVTVKASSAVTYGRTARINVTTSSDKGPAEGATATLLWSESVDGAVNAAEAKAQPIDTVVLDRSGAGAFTVDVERSGYFWVEITATSTTRAAESGPVRTKVRWKVSPDSRALTAVTGGQFTLAGAIAPQAEGVTIRIQKRSGDRWRTIRKVVTDPTGRFASDVRVLKPKEMTYRFVAGNGDGFVRGVSPKVTVTVTSG